MTARGRYNNEWDTMQEEFNNSTYDPQYPDDDASGGVQLDHCRLYIRNIPKGLNEEGLRTAFAKYGTLNEVHVSKDPIKRYALVRYETAGEAKAAMAKLNNIEPLKLLITVAHKNKVGRKDNSQSRDSMDRSFSNGPRRNFNREDTASVSSKGKDSRRHEDLINGDEMDNTLLPIDDDMDPDTKMKGLELELQAVRLQQQLLQYAAAKKKVQLTQGTTSNRCILPDGRIVVRNVHDQNLGSRDVEGSFAAGAGDSLTIPALQRVASRACVACGAVADSFCARCGLTPYCSTQCQRRDWAERHRDVCHNLARVSGKSEKPDLVDVNQNVPETNSMPPAAPLRRPHSPAKQQPKREEDDSFNNILKKPQDNRPQGNRTFNHGPRNFSNSKPAPRQPRPGNLGNQDDSKEEDENWGNKTTNTPVPTTAPAISTTQQSPKPAEQPSTSQPQPKEYAQKVAQPQPKELAQKVAQPQPKEPATQKVGTRIANGLKPPGSLNAATPVPVVAKKLVPKKADGSAMKPQPKEPATQKVGTRIANGLKPPGSLNAATPVPVAARKMVPKNYLIELLSIGDTVLLSVESTAAVCKAQRPGFVCLSMHERFETDYQRLCEQYTVDCDKEKGEPARGPGESFSYLNSADGGWYRARWLSATLAALLDSGKVVTVASGDQLKPLTAEYEAPPEFCCLLSAKVEVGHNLKCTLISKSSDGYKVSLEDVESGSPVGEGEVSRWLPEVQYPVQTPAVTAVPPQIPEVPRPDLVNNSKVILVDATALDRVFVRPSDPASQRKYDQILQEVVLYGQKATPVAEPPQKGQVVVGKFEELHYRALCKRTSVKQNKYLLEYIEFGNVEVVTLDNIYSCPPNLDLSAQPTELSLASLQSSCAARALTPPALEMLGALKENAAELVLTLPSGANTAASGSAICLSVVKTGESVNKKVEQMCTPEWKKIEESGGDVVDTKPLMYNVDLEYLELPASGCEVEVLDISTLQAGLVSGCQKGLPYAKQVLGSLTEQMAEYCNSEIGKEPYLPKYEELCIAQCPPYPQWFRSVLLEQSPGSAAARLFYVDYGNVEEVPVDLLRKMLPEFVRGLPALASHLEIKDFPKEATTEMLARAVEHMKIDEEGRGTLTVTSCEKQEFGLYLVEAPGLIQAMIGK